LIDASLSSESSDESRHANTRSGANNATEDPTDDTEDLSDGDDTVMPDSDHDPLQFERKLADLESSTAAIIAENEKLKRDLGELVAEQLRVDPTGLIAKLASWQSRKAQALMNISRENPKASSSSSIGGCPTPEPWHSPTGLSAQMTGRSSYWPPGEHGIMNRELFAREPQVRSVGEGPVSLGGVIMESVGRVAVRGNRGL